MSQLIQPSLSVNDTHVADLLHDLAELSRTAETVRRKIKVLFPQFGSDSWWEKQEEKVDRELKDNKYTTFASMDQAISHLIVHT